jgi:hypothetical protein
MQIERRFRALVLIADAGMGCIHVTHFPIDKIERKIGGAIIRLKKRKVSSATGIRADLKRLVRREKLTRTK